MLTFLKMIGGVRTKAAFYTVSGIACVIYLLYIILPLHFSDEPLYRSYSSASSWKRNHIIEAIPSSFWDKKDGLTIQEQTVKIGTVSENLLEVAYNKVTGTSDNQKSTTVLFIHGSEGSSQSWIELQSPQLASLMGYTSIVVDLPGWGSTKPSEKINKETFIEDFLEALEITRPIIVASSTAGSFVLPYLMKPNPVTCEKRVKALVTVGLVGADLYTPSQYHRCETPTMIVYGEKDKQHGLSAVGDLRNLADNSIFPMKKASHFCHKERPDEWHVYLYNFLLAMKKTTKK